MEDEGDDDDGGDWGEKGAGGRGWAAPTPQRPTQERRGRPAPNGTQTPATAPRSAATTTTTKTTTESTTQRNTTHRHAPKKPVRPQKVEALLDRRQDGPPVVAWLAAKFERLGYRSWAHRVVCSAGEEGEGGGGRLCLCAYIQGF